MAKFIDIGALWISGREKKTYANGTLDTQKLSDFMELCKEDKIRIFLMEADKRKSQSPDFRITAVTDEDGDAGRPPRKRIVNERGERPRGRERDERRERDRDGVQYPDRDAPRARPKGNRDEDPEDPRDQDNPRRGRGRDDDDEVPF